MNLPKLSVARPITMLMLLVSILVIGGLAMKRLPLAFLPEIDAPFIGVQVQYPNSNPTQIEKEIVKPIEEALSTLSGIKKLEATATADSAEIEMEFRWGEELDVLRMQVSEKIEAVKPRLPPGVGDVFIFSFNTSDIPVIQARIAAEGVDLSANYELLETRIRNRVRRVPGVARVDLDGVAPREISIDLVLDKVKEHAVDIGALARRLQGASANLVLGSVNDSGLRYTARAVGAFSSLETIGDLWVNERGLKLRDIAEITYEEPPIAFGRHLEGRDAVALTVYKESTANTVDVSRRVMKVIKEDIANDPLLDGVSLFFWEDQADMIVSGVDGLRDAGLIGSLLAIIVLYYFLRRLDATLIVALSIPFSILAACAVMYFMGMSLNILSMMGLILGVGMLVDNAIVVLESIDRTQREEKDAKRAALIGTSRVALAVTAATATSIIVFLPLVVGSDNELTVWLGEVGIAISLSLVCSLFCSLTLIPMVAAHFLKRREVKPAWGIARLEERYARALRWTFRHKLGTVGIIVGALALAILPFPLGLVETGMFSANKNERLRLSYEFDDFSYKSDSERAVARVEETMFAKGKDLGVVGVYSYFAENEAATWFTLSKKGLPERQLKELRKSIREALPTIPGVKLRFEDDAEEGGNSTYFAVKFYGQDGSVLNDLADEAMRRLESVSGVVDVSTGLNRAHREIQVVIDRQKAARLGLSAQDLSDIFAFTLGGQRLRRFNTGEREVETWLALRPEDRTNLDDLRKLQFSAGAEGAPVTLGDVASFHVVRRAQEIRRENRKVRLAVRATYEGKDWDKAKEEITGLMDAFNLPPGTSWSYDDRIIEQESQDQQMLQNLLLALALVFIVMASLFESLTQPFAILIAILLSWPGAIWMLAATRTPMNMMAQIGFLILMGVVVNNGIVLLDHFNQLRRGGMAMEEAVVQAGRDRLRPVVMTALTTTLALSPLALGGATVGGLFYFPLARCVMGGLISSTFLTLLVLPLINYGVERGAERLRGFWRSSAPGADAEQVADLPGRS